MADLLVNLLVTGWLFLVVVWILGSRLNQVERRLDDVERKTREIHVD